MKTRRVFLLIVFTYLPHGDFRIKQCYSVAQAEAFRKKLILAASGGLLLFRHSNDTRACDNVRTKSDVGARGILEFVSVDQC